MSSRNDSNRSSNATPSIKKNKGTLIEHKLPKMKHVLKSVSTFNLIS